MTTIYIYDDPSATRAPVVKLRCECPWEDKTFRGGCLSLAVTHFVSKHGGNGRISYKGEWRIVENGRLEPILPTQ